MSASVIVRRIAATPARTSAEAWQVIHGLLAQDGSSAWQELDRVGSLVMTLIAAEAMRESPIVVYGVGPRLRLYCLYDDEAILGENLAEEPLSWCPTDGDWAISLPCSADDLSWMETALANTTLRVTARDLSETVPMETSEQTNKSSKETWPVDKESFLKS